MREYDFYKLVIKDVRKRQIKDFDDLLDFLIGIFGKPVSIDFREEEISFRTISNGFVVFSYSLLANVYHLRLKYWRRYQENGTNKRISSGNIPLWWDKDRE